MKSGGGSMLLCCLSQCSLLTEQRAASVTVGTQATVSHRSVICTQELAGRGREGTGNSSKHAPASSFLSQ